MKKFLLLFLIVSCVGSLSAQRFNGTWKRIVRPGPDPCLTDMMLVIKQKSGPVDIWYGSQTEDCEELVESYDRWTVAREEVAGQRKKVDVIYLHVGEEEPVRWQLVELNNTFMKVRMLMFYEDGSTEEQDLIFKRV